MAYKNNQNLKSQKIQINNRDLFQNENIAKSIVSGNLPSDSHPSGGDPTGDHLSRRDPISNHPNKFRPIDQRIPTMRKQFDKNILNSAAIAAELRLSNNSHHHDDVNLNYRKNSF